MGLVKRTSERTCLKTKGLAEQAENTPAYIPLRGNIDHGSDILPSRANSWRLDIGLDEFAGDQSICVEFLGRCFAIYCHLANAS
jgi:hypothetical protein